MERELILCIPGPWADRADFIRRLVATEPKGRFMFAGDVLADLQEQDHVPLEFCGQAARMGEAFQTAGQGRLPEDCLERIREHRAVAYLHFPINLEEQRERVAKFTGVMRRAGGMAVKVESAGVAHTWETWEARLRGSRFDLYCCAIVLVKDERSFYSCGMHHFGLPECEVPSYMGLASGADLINRFNSWRLNDRPKLKSGETFSLAVDEPPFQLERRPDTRHAPDDLFHNPHGVWCLSRATSADAIPNQWKKPDGEPLFVMLANDNEQMLQAYAKARQTLPRFLRALGSARFSGAIHSVKVKLRDDEHSEKLGEDRFAYIWLWDVQPGVGTTLQATVRELPKGGLSGLAAGETIHFDQQDVHDWMIVEGSQAWGGFTLRVMRDRMQAQERLQYDEYTGILCYNELE